MSNELPETGENNGSVVANHFAALLRTLNFNNLWALVTGSHRSILPTQTKSGRSLTIVVSAMCYLAVLAVIANILINGSVQAWTADVARQITVQIKPVEGEKMEVQIEAALTILKATRGIVSTSTLSNQESLKLLEPWLGTGSLLADLPVPRLISVVIDEKNPPDFDLLTQRLTQGIKGASLDTHKRWQGQILRSANALKMISLGILILISITTVAIIIFATRAAMASNEEVISVLHLVGAHDNFIAEEVQSRFFIVGLKSGLISVACGILTYIILGLFLTSYFGSGPDQTGFQFLTGQTSLGFLGFLALFTVPLAAVIICLATSRIVVLRILAGVL